VLDGPSSNYNLEKGVYLVGFWNRSAIRPDFIEKPPSQAVYVKDFQSEQSNGEPNQDLEIVAIMCVGYGVATEVLFKPPD
jgi:hypothetical protein